MIGRIAAPLTALMVGVAGVAGTAPSRPTSRAPRTVVPTPAAPTLVVLLTVDQLADPYLDRYGREFTGGFARLLRGGARWTRAYQDHGITETAPGHASLLSGRHPRSNGIQRNDEGVPDPNHPLLEVPGEGASPFRFRGTALLDWMRARWPDARALSVSRKNRSAILPVGRSREGVGVYWYVAGQMTTSRYYADSLPTWVRDFNAAMVPARAPGRVWNLLRAPDSYPEPDSVPWEHNGRDVVFPHRLPDDTAAAATNVRDMPWMDSLLLAFALEGMRRHGIGATPGRPDLLAISLSTTDGVGHAWGPLSREIHDHLLCLDRFLDAFLDSLARRHDPARTVIVLTSDHGITPQPEIVRSRGGAAGFIPVDTLLTRMRATLETRLGPGGWIPWRDVGLIALDRRALQTGAVDVDSLAADLAARIRRMPGVARVDTRRTLARADTSRTAAARRWLHTVDSVNLGEVMVTPHAGWYFGRRSADASHGHNTEVDSHVPLIFMGSGVRPGRYTRRAATVDIAPTLAALLGIDPLERVDGRILREGLQ